LAAISRISLFGEDGEKTNKAIILKELYNDSGNIVEPESHKK